MRHIVLVMVVFWYSLVPTQLFGLGKVPPLPADPYGEEAFKTIKAFYGLKKGLPRFSVASIESENHTHYRLQTVRLQIDNYPNISLTLKIPNQFRPPVSALVLFTGFQTGSDSIHLVGDPQDSVYVAFQYPWPILHKEGTIRWDWSQMQMIPVLMSVGLAWLHQQPFINKEKINVATVSFGTLFYPLAQRLLNEQELYSKTTIFAYGGVDIPGIIGAELKKSVNPVVTEFTRGLIEEQTWFVEPKYHVKHLRGPFLVVNGEDDTVFPAHSQQQLWEDLQEPKELVMLPGGHIQPDKTELIEMFMKEVVTFLQAQQAL